MPAPRYLANVLGRINMLAAITSSAGAADAEKVVATAEGTGVLDDTIMGAATTGVSKVVKTLATGLLDPSIMPSGIGADTASVVTSENLAAGDLVNIYDVAGTPTARKADATVEGKECVGFVLNSSTSPAAALVHFESKITGLTGMVAGARQYMSTTPGARTAVAPTEVGNVVQAVGIAISDSVLSFEPQEPVTVA